MKAFKVKTRETKSVYVLFVLSYVSILLLALTSSIVYGIRINAQVSRQTQLSKQALLDSLQNKVEDNIAYIEDLSDNLVFNDKIDHFVRGSAAYTSATVMKELAGKQKPRALLFDYFLYRADTDEIITSTIRMKAPLFFDIMYSFVDFDYDAFHAKYLEDYHFRSYMPVETIRAYDETLVTVLPYIQSVPMNSTEKALGQVIFFIDAKQLFSQVDQIHNATSSDVYLLNENDELIMASSDAPMPDAKVLENREPFKTIGNTVITLKSSASTGWRYLIATPQNLYYQDNIQTLLTLLPIFLLYLIGGLFLVRRLARRSYRPVQDIQEMIVEKATDTGGGNEFEAIKRTLLAQTQNDLQLRDIIDHQRPAVLRDCLIHLLTGQTVDSAAAEKQLRTLGVFAQSDCYLIVMAEIDTESNFFMHKGENAAGQELSLARVIVTNVGCELFESKFSCQHVDFEQNQKVFLLNLHADTLPAQADKLAEEIAVQLADFARTTFELTIDMGVSMVQHGLQCVSYCLDDARKALEYSRLQANGNPVLYRDVQNVKFDYYYPPEAEQQLLNHVKSGCGEQAKQVLTHVLEANSAKQIGTVAAKSLLYEITATLQRVAYSYTILSSEESAFLFNEATVASIVESTSLDQARTRLFTVVDQLTSAIQSYNPGKPELLAQKVAAYIDANNAFAWLDLNALSAEFHVTPQYISNIFKKYKNENIKDYIAKGKLKQAKSLLENTDLPVKDIAAQLGYAGEISIIRLMRKYEGTTPGDYRQTHRNH
ncbi:MAG: helix-turn-helix domain-containing protein [Ruthenibacterium sp.]